MSQCKNRLMDAGRMQQACHAVHAKLLIDKGIVIVLLLQLMQQLLLSKLCSSCQATLQQCCCGLNDVVFSITLMMRLHPASLLVFSWMVQQQKAPALEWIELREQRYCSHCSSHLIMARLAPTRLKAPPNLPAVFVVKLQL
jgi:hypothetical protein